MVFYPDEGEISYRISISHGIIWVGYYLIFSTSLKILVPEDNSNSQFLLFLFSLLKKWVLSMPWLKKNL